MKEPIYSKNAYNDGSAAIWNWDYLLFRIFVVQMGQINQCLPHNLDDHNAMSQKNGKALMHHSWRMALELAEVPILDTDFNTTVA